MKQQSWMALSCIFGALLIMSVCVFTSHCQKKYYTLYPFVTVNLCDRKLWFLTPFVDLLIAIKFL